MAASSKAKRLVIWALVCLTLGGTSLAVGLKLCWWWFQASAPVLLTIGSLWGIRGIYLWQRRASFQRREHRRTTSPAEKLEIPAGVKKPEQYDGGKTLHDAQWTYIGEAVEAQGDYFSHGILAASLPPLALFLLAFQLMAFAEGGALAIGLIFSEALALLILVYFAITDREPTAEWIYNRLRAELLRREQYLLLGGVGPYLTMQAPEASQQALRRRSEIESAEDSSLFSMVPLQDRSGVTWLEALHRASGIPSFPDALDRMQSYLYNRIGKQSLWFANELRDCAENERLWARLLTGALLVAILVAGVHAFLLSRTSDADPTPDRFGLIVAALGIVLPPLGTAFIGIRAMYNFRGRRRIYGHERNRLRTHKGPLEALILEAQTLRAADASFRTIEEIDFDFRALVLRTEHSLSLEMEQWVLLMERQDHEVSP